MEYRVFSLRMPSALAARLERAKAIFGHGELSTGEVARRLLEQRLEQWEHQEAHAQARETLRHMVAKARATLVWTPAEWHCLTHYATEAYRHASRQGRSVVDRTLLLAVMQACAALRPHGQMGTLTCQRGQGQDTGPPQAAPDGITDLLDGTQAWAPVPPQPTPEMGVAVCQQLAALVHAVPPDALPGLDHGIGHPSK
jgi:hypothetical protein